MNTVWRYFDPYFRYEHELTGTSQAWSGHRLFVYDLVRNIKPKTIVELGTHHGNSFFAMCEALHDEGLVETKITAVDTWAGDKHAGFYGADVFNVFTRVLGKYYDWLHADYLKMTFDEALNQITHSHIDLLHIDGLHTYEAVKKDFTQWFSRVAEGGIIIMHDIHEFRDDFGVHQLWDELKSEYVTVSFFHSHGLGVLIKGASPYSTFFAQNEIIWQRYYHVSYDLKKSRDVIAAQQNENSDLQLQVGSLTEENKSLHNELETLARQYEVDLAWAHKQVAEVQHEVSTITQQVIDAQEVSHTLAQEVAALKELHMQQVTKTLEATELLVASKDAERLLTEKNSELKSALLSERQESERLAADDRNRRVIINKLELQLQHDASIIAQLHHELAHLRQEMATWSNSKFWKLRTHYMNVQWAYHHPLKFLKKHVSSQIPTRPELVQWVYKWRTRIGSYIPQVMPAPERRHKEINPYISPKLQLLRPGQFYTQHVTPGSIAVILHLYHEDMWEEIVGYLKNIQHDFYLLVSLTQGNYSQHIHRKIKEFKPNAIIVIFENKGLDIIPFIKLLDRVPEGVKYILKVHTKKSPYNTSMGRRWFTDLMSHVLLSPEYVNGVLHNLEYSDAGMIGGSNTLPLGTMFHSSEVREPEIDRIYECTGESETDFYWISGSIFWVRYDIVKSLTQKKIIRLIDAHQPRGYHENGTIVHAMERYFGKMVYDAGKVIYLEPQIRYSAGRISTVVRPQTGIVPTSDKKYYAFFHICCMNNYREVVHELIDALRNAGLYDRLTTIYYSVVGVPSDVFTKEINNIPKMECVYMSPDMTDVEYPMITFMYRFAQNHDGYLLYFHTKGVSTPHDVARTEWRKTLTEKTITEYQVCVDFLDRGCDVAGPAWKEHPHIEGMVVPYSTYKQSHFSGNFYWATASYVRSLPDPRALEIAHRAYKYTTDIRFEEYRVMCEVWIGINNPKVGVHGDFNVNYPQIN